MCNQSIKLFKYIQERTSDEANHNESMRVQVRVKPKATRSIDNRSNYSSPIELLPCFKIGFGTKSEMCTEYEGGMFSSLDSLALDKYE